MMGRSTSLKLFVCSAAAATIALAVLIKRHRSRYVHHDADPGPTDGEPLRRLRKAETVLSKRVGHKLVLILEAAVDIQNITTVLRTAECLGLQNVWIILPRNGSKRKSGDPLSAPDGIVATTDNLASAASCSNALTVTAHTGSATATSEESKSCIVCQTCGKDLPVSAFSQSQRQRLNGTARCRGCVRTNRGLGVTSKGDAPTTSGEANDNELSSASTYRVARESAEWLDVRTFGTTDEAIECAHGLGMELWVTALSPGAERLDGSWQPPRRWPPGGVGLVIGREADGVSEQMLRAADRLLYYPLSGWTESLNMGVAAALIMHVVLERVPSLRGGAEAHELLERRRQWYARLARTDAQRVLFDEALQRGIAGRGWPRAFGDLRYAEGRPKGSWIPKKIRRREEARRQIANRPPWA